MKSISKIALAACILFASCQKKDDPATPVVPLVPVENTGKVYMEFKSMAGADGLTLDNQWYQNEGGDSFKVTRFNYYISNIVLNGTDGTSNYAEQESYHLIESPATPGLVPFDVKDVPAGKYRSVTFMIGVDSTRNVSGAQTGALDPVLGNFWSWNSGYIMLKFEGISPSSPNADGRLILHCGGFSGANKVLKTVTLDFPEVVAVDAQNMPRVHVEADVLQLFKAPNLIRFANTATIHMPGVAAKALSDNYATMFKVTYAGR
jgi:hypothetical protein